MKKGPIAYIMSRFPHLSETFILREMDELENLGWEIKLFPLVIQNQPVIHPTAKHWLNEAIASPFISPGVIKANLIKFFKFPGDYISLWFKTIKENVESPKFLVRKIALFPKTVYMAEKMEKMGIRHIHAHYATHPAFSAWLIHKLTGISYSVTVHAHDIFVEQAMLKTKLREAKFVVAISEFNREFLAEHVGGWVLDKTHVVHCGIKPENYNFSQNEKNPGCFEILSIGSLQAYKGFPYLIKACAKLRDQGVPFRCRIIGGGEEYQSLERTISSYGLGEHVFLLGPKTQEEVSLLLKEADCYVQPSVITPSRKMEGIPVALMEALASGLPVVATAISGIPELVRQGQTGFLAEPKDSNQLAELLAKVYTKPDQALKLAQAGRELVLKEFELSVNVKQLANLFAEINPQELPNRAI